MFVDFLTESGERIAVITLVGVVFTAIFGFLATRNRNQKDELAEEKKKNDEKQKKIDELEVKLQLAEQSETNFYPVEFLQMLFHWGWAEVRLASDIFDKTKTDRFVFFVAWNGIQNPTTCTALYHNVRGQAQRSPYQNFELDSDYVDKLTLMQRKKMICIDTETLEHDCAIGRAYRGEEPPITHAEWHHIKNIKTENGRSLIVYCSFATFSAEKFDLREEVKHRNFVNELRQFFDTNLIHTTFA